MNTTMHYNAPKQIFDNAKALRKKSTEAEKIMWNVLKDRKLLGIKFRRQHPIENFIVDFYSHEKNIAIEIDGEYHNTNEQKEYDEGRFYEINKYNTHIIRFSNKEIMENLENVIEELKKIIIKHKNNHNTRK